jgi:multicomponent K+:H+ antiporter subunit G
MVLEALIALAIIIGSTFVFVGSFGLLRLQDLYCRLHAPTKATTLGLGAMLLASVLFFSTYEGGISLHEILVSVFLFLTAPASAHMLARAGLHQRVRTVTREPDDVAAFPETGGAGEPDGGEESDRQ